MIYFISYDITNTQRRKKISKALERFGIRMQKSAFQCDISAVMAEKIKTALLEIFNEKEDNLLFFSVCKDCFEKIILIGKESLLKNETFEIL